MKFRWQQPGQNPVQQIPAQKNVPGQPQYGLPLGVGRGGGPLSEAVMTHISKPAWISTLHLMTYKAFSPAESAILGNPAPLVRPHTENWPIAPTAGILPGKPQDMLRAAPSLLEVWTSNTPRRETSVT